MKKFLFLMVIFGLTFIACQKDTVHGPFVSITGNFILTPDPGAGNLQVLKPDGSYYESPRMYKVDGTCDFFENIDENHSLMETSSMHYKSSCGGYEGQILITLVAENGDHLYLRGDMTMYQDNSNNCFFHFDGGTGKFRNAEGWMNMVGQSDPNTRQNVLTAAGEICEPN